MACVVVSDAFDSLPCCTPRPLACELDFDLHCDTLRRGARSSRSFSHLLSRTMAPKRKDAKAKAPAAPTPASAGYTRSQLDAKATAIAKPLAVWVRLAFRLFCLVSVGLYLWPQLFPKKTEEQVQAHHEDLELGGGYEPIELDEDRRAAVLEAFKVSAAG